MRIGEVAAFAGTTVRAVRHYHRLGLLPEPRRLANGYREYTFGDAVRLTRIRRLAEDGVPLGSIAAVLGADGVGDAVDREDVLADLRELLAGLRVERERLAGRERALSALLADVDAGQPISALPGKLAGLFAATLADAEAGAVREALVRERDALEALASTGRMPDGLAAEFASALGDEARRSEYFAILREWADLEGRRPHAVRDRIDALSGRIIDSFGDRMSEMFGTASEAGTGAGGGPGLADIVPDPAQREVIARVHRAVCDGSGAGR